MEKESNVGVARVVASSKKNKNDDPLPFLRKKQQQISIWFLVGVWVKQQKEREWHLVQ